MGWASGSSLAEEVWCLVRGFIPADKREKVAREVVDAFRDMDCDTMYEAETLMDDADLVEDDDLDDDDEEEYDDFDDDDFLDDDDDL